MVASLAQTMRLQPLYFMVPVTLTTSLAFALPVSTPPNALAFASGRVRIADMIPMGIALNLIGVGVVLLGISTWGRLFFDLGHFPDWAEPVEEAAAAGQAGQLQTASTC